MEEASIAPPLAAVTSFGSQADVPVTPPRKDSSDTVGEPAWLAAATPPRKESNETVEEPAWLTDAVKRASDQGMVLPPSQRSSFHGAIENDTLDLEAPTPLMPSRTSSFTSGRAPCHQPQQPGGLPGGTACLAAGV